MKEVVAPAPGSSNSAPAMLKVTSGSEICPRARDVLLPSLRRAVLCGCLAFPRTDEKGNKVDIKDRGADDKAWLARKTITARQLVYQFAPLL